MDIRVSKATRQDADDLLDIKREASTVLLARLGHTLGEIGAWQEKFVTPAYIAQHLRAPHSLYLIREGEDIKGMAGLTLKDDGDDVFALFGNLYCLESGNGLGSRLMEYRMGVVEAFNLDFIQCHVHSENERAQRFLSHYGFIRYGSYDEPRLGRPNFIYRKAM